MTFLWAFLLAVAMIWVAGSIFITALRPWRMFDRADRWLAWALMLAWLPIALAMMAELLVEYVEAKRADKKARLARGR